MDTQTYDKIEDITSTLVGSWEDLKLELGIDASNPTVRSFDSTIRELHQTVRQTVKS